MRILIDECLPRHLAGWLSPHHEAVTVGSLGWANLKNGHLLRAADAARYDVLITADKNMYYQQNFAGLHISAIVIPSNRKRLVQQSVNAVLQSIGQIAPGQKVVMDLGPNPDTWTDARLISVTPTATHSIHKFAEPTFGG